MGYLKIVFYGLLAFIERHPIFCFILLLLALFAPFVFKWIGWVILGIIALALIGLLIMSLRFRKMKRQMEEQMRNAGGGFGGGFGDFGDLGDIFGSIFGAFCATLGVVLPSFVIILIVAKVYDKFKNSTIVAGCMTGLKPAVIGFIGAAALSIAATVFFKNGISLSIFKTTDFYVSLGVFVLAVFLTFYKKLHPIIIICISAILGIAAGYFL